MYLQSYSLDSMDNTTYNNKGVGYVFNDCKVLQTGSVLFASYSSC